MISFIKHRPRLSAFLGVLVILLLLLGLLSLRPFSLKGTFTPDPVGSYQEALARIESIQAAEAEIPNLSPECGTTLFTHNKAVDNVIIFLHGFTSCPDQFVMLGERYFEQGYNVYIPRQPRHGLQELKGTPLKGLTAEELAAFGTQTADIAQGLGERVVVVGLSGGGSIATWLSQERPDIDLAVPIAPFLGVGFIPRPLNRPVTNLILMIPDIYQWWDPVHQLSNPFAASYSYRGYYFHALFENLRLGFAAEQDARRVKPAAGSILVITNANDISVNNGVIAEFEQVWREHGEEFLQTYQFPKEQDIPHDLITYTRPGGHPDVVYPVLLKLIR